MAIIEKTKDKNSTSTKPSNTRHIPILVLGDALAFLIFAAIGRGSHGESTGITALPQIALTAAPFALAWFIVAPLVGAYRRELITNPGKMAARTLLAWILSWPLAMTLRGIFVDHAIPPVTFALITLVFNTGILLLWRWLYAMISILRRR
jgi:hypothetical protein